MRDKQRIWVLTAIKMALKKSYVILGIFATFLIGFVFNLLHIKGYITDSFGKVVDILVVSLAMFLCVRNLINATREKKYVICYIILANLFLLIALIHGLRFFYGGLLC